MCDIENFKQDNTTNLSIKIENNHLPIELESFSKSLMSLSYLYSYFKKLDTPEKLFIKEINKGSIIVEITSVVINSIEHTNRH